MQEGEPACCTSSKAHPVAYVEEVHKGEAGIGEAVVGRPTCCGAPCLMYGSDAQPCADRCQKFCSEI